MAPGAVAGDLSLDCTSGQFDRAKEAIMPGASEQTRRVKNLNANWTPDGDEGDGLFEILIVTEDDQRYDMPASPGAMTALAALAKADTVMMWDPLNRLLIIANIVGTMPWTAAGSS
jgi:hypothetical protein